MHGKFAAAILGIGSTDDSQNRISDWAHLVSKRFIENGVPLNDSIVSIARENNLNKNFIERLCEAANLASHASLIPKTPEDRAAFSFPLADASEIVSSLKVKPETNKILSDYTCPPQDLPGGGPTMAEMFGVQDVEPPPCDDEKHRIRVIIEKKAALRDRIKTAMIVEAMKSETVERKVHHLAKQAVLGGTSLLDVYVAAQKMGNGDVAKRVLMKTSELLKRQGASDMDLMKKASFEVDEELIDRSLPVTVINGRSTLLSSIDTLKKHTENLRKLNNKLVGIEDEVGFLSQKIKEL